MLHVLLAVDIICFSLGLVIIAISILSYARSGLVVFRHLALLFAGVVILLLCRTVKVYEYATAEVVFGGHLPVLAAALTVPGNGLFFGMICVIAFEVASRPVSGLWLLLCIVGSLGAAVLGGMRELLGLTALRIANNIGFAGLLVALRVVVMRGTGTATSEGFLTLVRRAGAVATASVPVLIAQLVLQATLPASPPLRNFPFVQIALYLALSGMVLFHLAWTYFEPGSVAAWYLPEDVANRYGISPREREIITMLVQGYPNRVIGEKLFISTTTVKNHIYHIYQKTGVTNKIQLINLINSPK